jgi:formylglycine-generating enzyme required for sulfatase activity
MRKLNSVFLFALLLSDSAMAQDADTVLTVSIPNGEFMQFAWIESGNFLMGTEEDDAPNAADEMPAHEVTISTGFYMGIFEITQGQWRAVMETNPWRFQRYTIDHVHSPASHISWDDVQEFIEVLNEWEGASVYRLPSEAEWEYAARGFTSSLWSFGESPNVLQLYSWYWTNAWNRGDSFAHLVGSKLPNPLGLYDVHGNVWEWVQDWYGPYSATPKTDPEGPSEGTRRVLRGGGFVSPVFEARSGIRSNESPDSRFSDIGARLVRRALPTPVRTESWGQVKVRIQAGERAQPPK